MDFSKVAEDLKKITYAGTYNKPFQNRVIKLCEKHLVKSEIFDRFMDMHQRVDSGEQINQALLTSFGLDIEVKEGSLDNIPSEGSVMVVGNHPFGIVDGMVIACLIRNVRDDIKIMAHQGISYLPQFKDYFLPINFDQTEEAKVTNKQTVQEFKRHLRDGGIGVIFPAGAVSTKRPLWKKNADPPWHPSAAKWANDFQCTVVPIFIDGKCGPFFQIASQFSMTLRLGALLYENAKLIDSKIGIRIGRDLKVQDLPSDWSSESIIEHLRSLAYGLAGLDSRGRQLKNAPSL